jgi:hypothetical protein
MDQSKQGFDMSKMSTASKIILGGGVLLLIDSFLRWQEVCIDLGVLGGGSVCGGASAWGGNGSFAGVIMGILLIALIVWEVMMIMGAASNVQIGISPVKLSAYIGFGAAAFGLLKFIFAVTNSPGIGAWIGIVLVLVVAYGAWMRFQEPEIAPAMPPPATGGDSGFTA